MQELGNRLRVRREELGITLRDIEQSTKISIRLLEKIENGEFGALPEGIFARNFIRQYCREVKLDPAPFLAGLDSEDTDDLPVESTNVSTENGGRWWIYLIVICCLAVVGWYTYQEYWSSTSQTSVRTGPAVRVEPPITEDVVVEPPDSKPESTVSMRRSAEEEGVAVPSQEPGLEDALTDQLEEQDTEVETATLRFVSAERCWVYLRCSDREMDFMLEAGEIYTVSCGFPVSLTLGNVGSVTLSLNGIPVELPTGNRVLRDFVLTAPPREGDQ